MKKIRVITERTHHIYSVVQAESTASYTSVVTYEVSESPVALREQR